MADGTDGGAPDKTLHTEKWF